MKPKGKKKKKKKVSNATYPTQCMKVGEIMCLFVRCHNGGRSPLLSLGPSWPFTFALFFIGGIYFTMFQFFLSWVPTVSVKYCISQSGLAINILILLAGILKNPGIPQSHLDRILKEKKSGKEENVEENSGDLENNTSTMRRKPEQVQVIT